MPNKLINFATLWKSIPKWQVQISKKHCSRTSLSRDLPVNYLQYTVWFVPKSTPDDLEIHWSGGLVKLWTPAACFTIFGIFQEYSIEYSIFQDSQHFAYLYIFLEYSWNIPYSKNFTIFLMEMFFGIWIFLTKIQFTMENCNIPTIFHIPNFSTLTLWPDFLEYSILEIFIFHGIFQEYSIGIFHGIFHF